MRIAVLWAFLLTIGKSIQGQVITNLQLPPLGLTLKSQLWNLSMINTSSSSYSIKIELTLSESVTGANVMKGTSSTINLPPGAKLITAKDLSPITYTILNGSYGLNGSPEGFLPVGVFEVCYQVVKINNDAPEILSEECETIEVEPVSPPQLVLPQDSELVDLSRPFFTWIPPSPLEGFANLSYDWILVEVLSTQTASEAIQNNAPLLTQQSIFTSSIQYPLSAPALDTGKIYAWRVIAKNSEAPIANSEIWTFRLRPSWIDTTNHSSVPVYVKMRSTEDASQARCGGILRFQFKNESSRTDAQIHLFELTSGVRNAVTINVSSLPVVFGDNYLSLDLSEEHNIKNGHLYLLELDNGTGEKWYLKFEFRRTN